MSLLSRIGRRSGEDETRATQLPTIASLEDLIRVLGSSEVTPTSAQQLNTALRHPVVYRSVSKISGIVAGLPWHAYRGRDVIEPRPALLQSPSPGMMRRTAWKRAAASSMLLRGGVSAWLTQPHPLRRDVTRIDLIHPDRVQWTPDRGWLVDNDEVDEWPLGPFWHVPLLVLPGSPQGVNPLEYARRTTYAGLAANEFGGNFFRDGGHPTAIVSPETDPGEAAAKALKQAVREATGGTKREPLVLPQTVKWTPIQINPEDSQFIDLMKFSGAELAGFFGLQPEHVGLPVEGGGSVQYSNRENRQADLLQDAIMPVLQPLEEAVSELMPRPQEVRFNVDGLLRADLKSRYESYTMAAQVQQTTGRPLLTVDEMRELENRPPLGDDGGNRNDEVQARQLAEIVQKIYLGVGVVLTSDEAREILNGAGAALPGGFVQTKAPGGGGQPAAGDDDE